MGSQKGLKAGSLLLVGGTIAAIVAAVWCMSGGGDSDAESEVRELRSRKIASTTAKGKSAKKNLSKRDRHAEYLKSLLPPEPKVEAKPVEKVEEKKIPLVKPDFLTDLDEEKKMTAEMKRMFLELQAALDLDNAKKVYALVHKLQLMDEWPDGIPRSVKMKALQALSWFGAAGMAEAVGFLADKDPEIRQESLSKFEEMLSDWDLGDTGISEIIKQVVKVVHDKDALDAFYFELNNMRPTVKADTVLAIYDSKNPEAISVLKDSMEFIFESADGEIKTRADVEAYLENALQVYEDNPEKAADDEEFYGPPKN